MVKSLNRESQITSPLPTPRRIIIFITSECNGSCDHCFLPGIPGTKNHQMSEENILSIFKAANKPVDPILTGGEPFLRNDLKKIIDELMKVRLIQSITLLSNGSFPDRIESICEEICRIHKKPLCLQLSLDGLAETHDRIRKIPDGFNKMLDTCEQAKRINFRHPHFSFIIHITIMRQNISEIAKLVDYLRKRGYPSRLSLVRGNSFSTFKVPEELLNSEYNPRTDVIFDTKEVERLLKRISEKHPLYFDSFQRQKFRIMLDTLYLRKRQIPCYAGYEDAVVYSGGDIAICEQVKPFGNLSKWNWDLLRAWNSEEAMEHRIKLLFCCCIHSCNIATSAYMQQHVAQKKN